MAFGLLTGTSGIQPDFLSRVEALRRAMPNGLGAQIGVKSGYRSPEHQAELFARAVQKYGSEAAARKWVAPPGHSQHNRGNAIDLSYGSPEAMRVAHQMAAQYGLTFPMSYENWHIEPVGARGGGQIGGAETAPSGGGPDPGVSDLLAQAASLNNSPLNTQTSSSGISPSLGAGGSAGGIIGDPSPIAIPDLRTRTEAQPSAPPVATSAPAPDTSQLADLFTLPTIGVPGGGPQGDPAALPGQAKPLARKVWK